MTMHDCAVNARDMVMPSQVEEIFQISSKDKALHFYQYVCQRAADHTNI